MSSRAASIASSEFLLRENRWHAPARMPRPCDCPRRAPCRARPARVRALLPRSSSPRAPDASAAWSAMAAADTTNTSERRLQSPRARWPTPRVLHCCVTLGTWSLAWSPGHGVRPERRCSRVSAANNRTGTKVPEELAVAKTNARAARLAANRAMSCERCRGQQAGEAIPP